MASDTSKTEAGSYTVTVTPKSTCAFSDGSTAAKSVSWTIAKRTITKPTLTNTTYTYDGTAYSPTINNFDSTYVTQTGTASSTNAGNFTLTYSLKNKTSTQWEGGGTDDIALSWVINKADPELTLSNDTIIFDNFAIILINGSLTEQQIIITYKGHTHNDFNYGRGLTVTCDDSDVRPVTLHDSAYYVEAVVPMPKFVCDAKVTVTLPANDNYIAAAKTFTVKCICEVNFADCTWAQIQKIAKLVLAHEVFENSIGSVKTFDCSPTLNLSDIARYTTDTQKPKSYTSLIIRLMDAPINKNYIFCRIEPPATNSSLANVFLDDETATDTTNSCFTKAKIGTLFERIYNSLPSGLREVMLDYTYRSYIRTGTSWSSGTPKYSKMFIVGLSDLHSKSTVNSITSSNSSIFDISTPFSYENDQFEYFANGNTAMRWQTNDGKQNVTWRWLLRDETKNSKSIKLDPRQSLSAPIEIENNVACDVNPLCCIG